MRCTKDNREGLMHREKLWLATIRDYIYLFKLLDQPGLCGMELSLFINRIVIVLEL